MPWWNTRVGKAAIWIREKIEATGIEPEQLLAVTEEIVRRIFGLFVRAWMRLIALFRRSR